MTLSTTRINQYGRRLYEKMLHGDKLSPDACADAYEMFVRRMRRYRDRHPENTKVSPRFVKQCERWITANLLISKKRKRTRAALELETAKREMSAPEKPQSSGNTFLFQKMESFFSHWVKEKPKARGYARLFILSHAFNLSPKRVQLFAPLVDVKKSEFVRQVRLVKKHVAKKIASRMQRELSTAGYWHARSLRIDLEAAEAVKRNHQARNTEKNACIAGQRRALERMRQLKTVPTLSVLAQIAGVSIAQVRQACSVCQAEIKKYFA